MIERHFHVPFVAKLALAEKQIQQNYRPLIAVHKWFARRPGTLFRALMLAEFGDRAVEETYYSGHRFDQKHVVDPFMGGGTTVVEANRLGCMVTAYDINPMSWWIVRQEIQDLDLDAYVAAATELRAELSKEMRNLFLTRCPKTGELAEAKYFLWVKTARCESCGKVHDLFPNYLLAQDVRHTANVFVCGHCGTLFEGQSRQNPGACPECGKPPPISHIATRGASRCLNCNSPVRYPAPGIPQHRLFAIEYHKPFNPGEGWRKGRLFKKPDADDMARIAEARERLSRLRPQFIPDDAIPKGDETERLHRWGYLRYKDLFNDRQLLGLEFICRWIGKVGDSRVREALATNLSDLLRYQNMLCRYDTMALKSLDVFSVHGFPVGLIQCESNILGIAGHRGMPVGSGGWLNIVEKFTRAKRYCSKPFEVRQSLGKKTEVPIAGEWIGTVRRDKETVEERYVNLVCGDSSVSSNWGQVDGVFTDPPYFGNVQYAELMDFCYVWLRRLVGSDHPEFANVTTRNAGELTGNVNMGRDLNHFTDGISNTFQRAANQLRVGCPLAFTYHHNSLDAYVPMAVAILDSGLTCSASLPCPAEMGASIHINGTGSSIVDTVFVCRQTGRVPRRWIVDTPEAMASLIGTEVDALKQAGLDATQGDIRCIVYGHMTRMAIWFLRQSWKRETDTSEKMAAVGKWFNAFGGLGAVLAALETVCSSAANRQEWQPIGVVREHAEAYDEVPF